MNQLLEWLSRFFSSWKLWIIVPPWDIGVRVRLGRMSKSLQPGPHFRMPFLDEITLVNTRLRVAASPCVTITGHGGKSRIITASVGYRIVDPNRALLRYSDPLTVVVSLLEAEMANGATSEVTANRLEKQLEDSGIALDFVRYVEDVEARTYRLLQNCWQPTTSEVPASAGVNRY